MKKSGFYIVLSAVILSFNTHAEDKKFLTVDELVEDGYTQLSGLQVIELMNTHTIKVVDIETEAVTVSKNDTNNDAIDRKFVEEKNESPSSFLDPRLLARAPALEGKIERRVIEDELVATDGVRTYHYRLYKKQKNIYAVRDIDHGNVFFEVKVK